MTDSKRAFPWVSACITVNDVDKAVDFYEKAFGFTCREKAPGEDGTTWHAELLYKDYLMMLGKAGGWGNNMQAPAVSGNPSPMSLYIYCENVDAFYEAALKAGAEKVQEPEDMFWGDRMCVISDLDGYLWSFAQRGDQHK
jgi:PhnB protein